MYVCDFSNPRAGKLCTHGAVIVTQCHLVRTVVATSRDIVAVTRQGAVGK